MCLDAFGKKGGMDQIYCLWPKKVSTVAYERRRKDEERTFCSSDSPSTSLVSLASKSSKQSDLPMILRVSEIPLNSPLRAFQAFSCTTEPLSGLVDIWCSSHGCFSSEFCCQAHQSGPSSQALSPVVQHRAALLLHSGVQPVSCLKKCL